MKVFRDYSTYLQQVVHIERRIHEACNMKQYQKALSDVRSLGTIVQNLDDWLVEAINEQKRD